MIETESSDPNLLQFSAAEKRKFLWKNKTVSPVRDDCLWKKLFSDTVQVRKPGTSDMLCVENERVYQGDALSLKDPIALIDELGEQVQQKHLEKLIAIDVVHDYFDRKNPQEKL